MWGGLCVKSKENEKNIQGIKQQKSKMEKNGMVECFCSPAEMVIS